MGQAPRRGRHDPRLPLCQPCPAVHQGLVLPLSHSDLNTTGPRDRPPGAKIRAFAWRQTCWINMQGFLNEPYNSLRPDLTNLRFVHILVGERWNLVCKSRALSKLAKSCGVGCISSSIAGW